MVKTNWARVRYAPKFDIKCDWAYENRACGHIKFD